MMRNTCAVAFAALVGLVWANQVRAQEGEDRYYSHRPFEFNVNVGGHRPDGADDTDVGVGARAFFHSRSGVSFGGNFTWVISNADFGGGDIDVNTYYYNAELEYTFPVPGMLQPFLGAGAGASTVKVSDSGSGTFSIAPAGLGLASSEEPHDSQTNLMIPLTAGIKLVPGSRRFAVRADVRDNVIMISGDADEGTEDETTHNWEVSGGISFLFGGGM
jgi:opacity protein-like surface antigen